MTKWPKKAPSPPLALDGSPLQAGSVKMWRSFWASPQAATVDLATDGGGLVRWIQAVDERLITGALVRRTRLVQGSTGQLRLNPLVHYLNTLNAEIERAEEHYGMTPKARNAVTRDVALPTDPVLDELRARREKRRA